MNDQALLSHALQENQLILTEKAEQQLMAYLNLMQTWNRVFNLTAITKPLDAIYLHLIDSLVIQPYLHGHRLLDVGTGAGLPGIPLAIAHPEQQWVLLDKNNKKTRFLTQVIAELKLSNVEVVQSRCENFHPTPCFDSILSRAFGNIRLFVETTKHLLCQDGILIAMKGKYPKEELDTIPNSFKLMDVTHLTIKGMNIERHLIRISKQ